MKAQRRLTSSLYIIAVLIFIFLISCSKKVNTVNGQPYTSPSDDTTATSMDTTIKTYLALGDSYTIGESVLVSERFPVQTVALLSGLGVQVSDPKIIAVTGWTTGNLIKALDASPPPKNDYSIVTLLIGVNNQYQHRSIDEYKSEFTLLLNRAIAYANNDTNHVFVLSIPDYSVTPFAKNSDTSRIANEIDSFNALNKTITTQVHVPYIDITPVSRDAKKYPSLIAGDGLHPSGQQYHEWAELLAPEIAKTF